MGCEAAQNERGRAIADPAVADDLVNLLWDRLNNHLYRHQALQWVADLAKRKDLSFGLYGRGWETHPQLHAFARGVVKPGEDLENLVRKSRINLQLEPFACFTHPRLLNGLFAGGFFLIRDHPFNRLPQRMLDFLAANVSDDAETVAQVRDAIAPENLEQFESLLTRCEAMSEQADPVQMTRNWQRAGLIASAKFRRALFGPEIFFKSRRFGAKCYCDFAADEDLRLRVAADLRRELEGRLELRVRLWPRCAANRRTLAGITNVKLSYVIISYNRRETLLQTLARLKKITRRLAQPVGSVGRRQCLDRRLRRGRPAAIPAGASHPQQKKSGDVRPQSCLCALRREIYHEPR